MRPTGHFRSYKLQQIYTVYDLFYDLLHGYTYSSYTQVIDLIGVDDGVWTHDRWNHNPELYQLSYAHH